MEKLTREELFINVVARINRYFIIMSCFFLIYFLLKVKIDIFLLLLALSYTIFALLSHKHLVITNRLAVELKRAKTTLADIARESAEMHPDR
ncbi:MAG: hypothetical protein V3S13_03495 [Candidatus Omnitrophota bacterium]